MSFVRPLPRLQDYAKVYTRGGWNQLPDVDMLHQDDGSQAASDAAENPAKSQPEDIPRMLLRTPEPLHFLKPTKKNNASTCPKSLSKQAERARRVCDKSKYTACSLLYYYVVVSKKYVVL